MENISIFLALFFSLDRLIKLRTVIHFFNRTAPNPPALWPTISLIQPITRGATNLEGNLHACFNLDYPIQIQHILVCDAADTQSQSICWELQDYHTSLNISVYLVEPDGTAIASKITKMNQGLAHARGEVLGFIDDDIAPKPNAMTQMIPYLLQPGVGAAFGLPCAVRWNTIWSSLMSIFINGNALISYIPLTYLTEPFTITPHIFTISRHNFDDAGGFEGMSGRIDDDHELARRLAAIRLKSVQTPVIYRVSNELVSFSEYTNQIKRWFAIPRQCMMPYLSLKQKTISSGLSLGLFIPSVVWLLTLIFPSTTTIICLVSILLVHLGVYVFCSSLYLKPLMPMSQIPLVPIAGAIAPLQMLWALLLGDNDIVWREQHLRLETGGKFQLIE